MKPAIVIETGVDKGLGAALLCTSKEQGGRYYGTDINPRAGYFLRGKYKEVGEILYGDSIESLTGFSQNPATLLYSLSSRPFALILE